MRLTKVAQAVFKPNGINRRDLLQIRYNALIFLIREIANTPSINLPQRNKFPRDSSMVGIGYASLKALRSTQNCHVLPDFFTKTTGEQ